MTNFEYFKDKILELQGIVNIAVKNGQIVACEGLACKNCDIERDKGQCSCSHYLTKWLYEEHVDKPTLTEQDYMFCKLVEKGCVTRDKVGTLWWFSSEPKKSEEYEQWLYMSEFDDGFSITEHFKNVTFDFIKWDDKKPWMIKDILQLEVVAVGK